MIESLSKSLAKDAWDNRLPVHCWSDPWVPPGISELLKNGKETLGLAQHPKYGAIVVQPTETGYEILYCEFEHDSLDYPNVFDMFPPEVSKVFKQVSSANKRANLYVHQYQIAVTAMNHTPEESIYRGLDCTAESADAFYWRWTKPAMTDLEQFARDLYVRARDAEHNHADIHVAISALYQLDLLSGALWDVADIGSYAL